MDHSAEETREAAQAWFDNLVPGLKKKDFDLAMNGLEVTADRRRVEKRPSEKDEIGAEGERLQDVGAAAEAAVDEDLLRRWGIEEAGERFSHLAGTVLFDILIDHGDRTFDQDVGAEDLHR